jgi:hypothetical protein
MFLADIPQSPLYHSFFGMPQHCHSLCFILKNSMNHCLRDTKGMGTVYHLLTTLLTLNNTYFNIQSIRFVDMGTIIICKIKTQTTVNPSEIMMWLST